MDRAVFVLVFLAALLVAVLAWPAIGGQGHFDYIPWEWKLALSFGFAVCLVMVARALSDGANSLTRAVVIWVVLAAAIVALMGHFSYQAHMEEDPEEREGNPRALFLPHPAARMFAQT